MVANNVCVSTIWNFLCITSLGRILLRWLVHFWKMCKPVSSVILIMHHQWEARCWWCTWLRHCATSRKVSDSISDVIIGISNWHNPSYRTMALGLTQPVIYMGTRNISRGGGGKNGRCVELTKPYHLHVTIFSKYGRLNILEHSEPVQASTGIVVPLLLTPWSRVLLEKLTRLCNLSRNFPHFYGIRRFFILLTSARHLSLS
jgi:hypothetical protein